MMPERPRSLSIHNPLSTRAIFGEAERIYQKLPSFIADSLPDAWGNQLFELMEQRELWQIHLPTAESRQKSSEAQQWRKDNKLTERSVTSLEKLAFIGKRGMGALVFFASEATKVERVPDFRLENVTVWLTQAQMAGLFQSSRTNILEHIQHIYEDEELEESSTCRKFRQVRQEGKRMVTREIPMYNLDLMISVGYRVNSKRGVLFRKWANRILKEYLVKGYAVNENILLAAHTLGLGAVWTALYPMEERYSAVKEAQKLPDTMMPLCTIVIGYQSFSMMKAGDAVLASVYIGASVAVGIMDLGIAKCHFEIGAGKDNFELE